MRYLFLDESGDHNLDLFDPNYPLFVLAGCALTQEEHDKTLTPLIKELKQKVFGSEKLVLHYIDYTRNQFGFERMIEQKTRELFYHQLNRVIKEADFSLFSCIVDKKKHKEKYGALAIDPYILSLEIIIEKFVQTLKAVKDKGVVIAESRGQQLDNELNLAFLDLKIRGTRYLRPKHITNCIDGFHIRKKEENLAGLQLVDSLVTPIGRRFCNRKNAYIDYGIIKSKFRKHECGKYRGYGLIILPK